MAWGTLQDLRVLPKGRFYDLHQVANPRVNFSYDGGYAEYLVAPIETFSPYTRELVSGRSRSPDVCRGHHF